MTRVVLVPGVLALLPAYGGIEDPVAELRGACLAATSWLGRDVEVLAGAQTARVAAWLLAETARAREGRVERSYLVLGNGSATRSEKAPGHLDARAEGFDAALGSGLREGRFEVDRALGRELWADVDAFDGVPSICPQAWLGMAGVDYDDAPYGVQYWVMRWTCGS